MWRLTSWTQQENSRDTNLDRAGRSGRAIVALSRGHRVVGWGEGKVRSRIRLHHRARLHGAYVLTVTVVGGGPHSKTHVRL
jgi:hypothetical protein